MPHLKSEYRKELTIGLSKSLRNDLKTSKLIQLTRYLSKKFDTFRDSIQSTITTCIYSRR